MILPSILEYSSQIAEKKFEYLLTNNNWKQLTDQKEVYSIHLDIVSKYFAQRKNVFMSLSVSSLWKIIKKYCQNDEKYYFSMHLMSDSEDLVEFEKYFLELFIPGNFSLKIFVYEKFVHYFRDKYSKSNIEFGPWYDQGKWDNTTNFEYNDNLLMTVEAGKSGQIKSDGSNDLVFKTINENHNKYFIVDGGWKIADKALFEGHSVDIVSAGDFWSKVKF